MTLKVEIEWGTQATKDDCKEGENKQIYEFDNEVMVVVYH